MTLDEKWHSLFPPEAKSAKLKKLEDNLMSLIKKQGEYNNSINELSKEKSKLMKEIVKKMEVVGAEEEDNKRNKRMQNIQNSLNDINNQIEKMQEELEETLPQQIEDANIKLIIESINCCYERMTDNNEMIKDINEWVTAIRNELKEKIITKQEKESENASIYAYMHDMMGPDLMEIFDLDGPDIIARLGSNNKV